MTTTRTGKIVYRRFDEIGEFADFIDRAPEYCKSKDYDVSWTGGTYDDAMRLVHTGSTLHIDKAEKIIDEMQDSTDIFTSGLPRMQSDVWGYVPDVPSAIANLPKTMFRRVISEEMSQTSPISIYIDIGVSAGIDHKQILNRGVACLALAMALQITRPVELHACFALNTKHTGATQCASIKVSHTPLDLARAVWFLTSPMTLRILAFTFGHAILNIKDQQSIGWGFQSDPTHSTYVAKMRETLGLTENDIFIKGGYVSDRKMLNNPVQWVKDMVQECNSKLLGESE